jgi:NAD+ synthase (glutamine-hydrolysing)
MPSLRLALAQTNPIVGATKANLEVALKVVREAAESGADLVLFGELAATGYPIEDLATRKDFLQDAETAVADFAAALATNGFGDITVVMGHPALAANSEQHWAIAQNVASVISQGKIQTRYAKHHLPNYSVFDEYRNFVAGTESVVFEVKGVRCGLLICEDIWQAGGPVAELSVNQADLALILNGSPFELDKTAQRTEITRNLVRDQKVAAAYVNLVGGQDDLVFDGASYAMDSTGEVVALANHFEADLVLVDFNASGSMQPVTETRKALSPEHAIWQALTLGLRDYVNKNGFKSVVLGLSGGIDSAVCAALAVDALGSDRVFGVSLPSQYSSDHSKSDAADLAERLEVALSVEPIEPAFELLEKQLKLDGLAAENLQARIRGVILMGLSNQHGHLVLTTGNKTELAVGYSTIYGDSVGGFAPLKDVDKTLVWRLARWRNEWAASQGLIAPIPTNSIEKPPSAELRPGQTDQDSLPEYDLLCEILDRYLEQKQSVAQLVADGFDAATVERVIQLVNTAEWKRRQGAIGPKITSMSFGRERRMPITNKYR